MKIIFFITEVEKGTLSILYCILIKFQFGDGHLGFASQYVVPLYIKRRKGRISECWSELQDLLCSEYQLD